MKIEYLLFSIAIWIQPSKYWIKFYFIRKRQCQCPWKKRQNNMAQNKNHPQPINRSRQIESSSRLIFRQQKESLFNSLLKFTHKKNPMSKISTTTPLLWVYYFRRLCTFELKFPLYRFSRLPRHKDRPSDWYDVFYGKFYI